eukprot:GEMP01045770.1.p1 GENE.GEMP01045770.1~~GEMP01045770.1.p1  ORF type:complete len:259 (+),score=44.43 GEMP01045770.1:126-902(+)
MGEIDHRGSCLLEVLRSPVFHVSIRQEHLESSYFVHEKVLTNSPFFAAQMRWNVMEPSAPTHAGLNSPLLVLNLPAQADIEIFEFLLVGWYTFSFNLVNSSIQQLLALLALCEILILQDLSATGVQELTRRTLTSSERAEVSTLAEVMGETTLARQLHAFNYTDECDNVWHLLFSRLPQMALEDDWENTSPERQEVLSFLNRHNFRFCRTCFSSWNYWRRIKSSWRHHVLRPSYLRIYKAPCKGIARSGSRTLSIFCI